MNKHCYIVGLPESGKTTFLAAFWCTIMQTSGRAMELINCTDHEYMQEIARHWAGCNKMEHTSIEDVRETVIEIRDTVKDEEFTLVLPDRDGEYFKYEKRTEATGKKFYEELAESDLILFFINSCKIKKNPLYGEIASKHIEIDAGDEEDTENTENKSGDNNFSSKMSVLDISLGEVAEHVELLQFMIKSGICPLKLRVIISAWDVFADDKHIAKPDDVIKKYMPLFWQMLEAWGNELEITYWGISAQGGDWDDKEDVARISQKNVEDRVVLVDSDGNSVDDMTRILL